MSSTSTREPRFTLAIQVYGRLLDDVWDGRWAPGETWSAYEIARRLGVSRTPVVEALKRLEAEGLIEILPKVGARLVEPQPQAREELFALAESLLGLSAERAAERVDDAWLDRSDELADAIGAAARAGDAVSFSRMIGEFDRHVIAGGFPTQRTAVTALWRSLSAQARHYLALGARPARVMEIRAIADAIRSGSGLRARAAAERHIRQVAANATVGARTNDVQSGAGHAGFVHAALLYQSNAELLACAVPFILSGLQQGERVVVISSAETLEAVGRALGRDASKVDYHDRARWYDSPAETLRAYRRYVETHSNGSRVRIIGELSWTSRASADVDDWLRYEALLNVALEGANASIVCPYDAERLPERIIAGMREAHPELYEEGGLRACPAYKTFLPAGP